MFIFFSKRREFKYLVVVYVRLYDNLYTNYKNVFIFFFFLWFPVLIVKIFK